MECIVKGCDGEAVKNKMCKEHYDPEKLPVGEKKAAGQACGHAASIGRQASLALHTALLVSGKLAGRLVRGYNNLIRVSPRERAEILEHIGSTILRRGKKEDSLSAFEDAVTLDAGNPEAHYNLGRAYAAAERFQKACASFTKALALDADYVEAHEALGEASYNCEDYASALKHLTKARAASPESESITYYLGLTHDKLKAFDKAIKFLQAAVDMNPRNAKYYYSLGFAYDSKGNKEEALENFKKAMELEKQGQED
jgi:tetratricopeptide (TPR) repeat protein